MKFTAALAVAAAPLALAKAVHNVYPVRRDASLSPRSPKAKAQGQGQGGNGELAQLGMSGVGITTNAAAGGAAPAEVIVIWVNPGNGAATTNVNAQATVTNTVTVTAPGAAATVAPAAAAAVTHQVMVGGAAGLAYTPSQLIAAVGDMVIFTFMNANHTATQSAFETPCLPLAGGMDSGFQPNANNTVNPPPQVAMQVMVATPLWFYCQQKGHCGKGMTFSINPTADKTQALFQSMAIAQNGTGTGSAITGGAPAAAPPAAAASNGTASAAPAAASGGAAAGGNVQSGQGTLANGGACTCAVTCSPGSFPAVNAQGLGAFGGMAGALPATMAEAV